MNISKYIPNAVSVKAARSLLHIKKASPGLLFGAGMVGFGATVVTASRATLKLEGTLEPHMENLEKARVLHESEHPDYSTMDYRRDVTIVRTRTVISVAKLYAVPLALGAASAACLTGSHFILSSRNVALTAAYAALDQTYRRYQERMVEEIGEDKERDIRTRVESWGVKGKDKKGKDVGTIVSGPTDSGASMYARFWGLDTAKKEWNTNPERNVIFLRCQQNWANDLLQSRGHVFLNDVYDMLGLERTSAGAVVGWVRGHGDDYVDFGIFSSNERDASRLLDYVTGHEDEILLDFNVDGVVYDLI